MDVTLVMFKENGQRKDFALDPGQTVIGRQEACDLRIPLPEISRKHTMLIVTDNAVTIRDLGSANGTYVNNQRITEQELNAGDHIVVGPMVFTIQINGEPTDVKQVHTRLERREAGATGAAASALGIGAAAGEADMFGGDDEDPIAALEALASSGDTAALNMSDSFPNLDDSKV
jgi:pSer/pThr/pTyr-binding forkhead associated (FHA) protein